MHFFSRALNTKRHFSIIPIVLIAFAFLLQLNAHAWAEPIDLPDIGANPSLVSSHIENKLGQAWLRSFRRQAPLEYDPLLVDYCESLLIKLASSQNITSLYNLSLVLVNNPSLNAFAVPGGVVGIHTGLFAQAETEGQFASVIAHEIAHLSQRHYARRVEQQKGQSFIGMTALLASFLIAATSDAQLGAAALNTTQASLMDNQLRFSRLYEEEADRIGMQVLLNAGFHPKSMIEMFEQMLRLSRFSTQVPEFLLTHPITIKRISDAEGRARQHTQTNKSSQSENNVHITYDLMRARALFLQERIPQQAVKRFESELKGLTSFAGSRYGLALALIASKRFDEANTILKPLLEQYPNEAAILIAQSKIEQGNNQISQAIERIQDAMVKKPNQYAFRFHLIELFTKINRYADAISELTKLKKERPQDPYVWFHLAEVAGLQGDIPTLHLARTEYFILHGEFDRAENQLNQIIEKFSEYEELVKQSLQRKSSLTELRQMQNL